jgi:hypothetical protein
METWCWQQQLVVEAALGRRREGEAEGQALAVPGRWRVRRRTRSWGVWWRRGRRLRRRWWRRRG